MASDLSVVILVHPHDGFENVNYYLTEMAKIWRSEGIRVTILKGPSSFVPADVAILHVDLTVVPADYQDFIRQYPLVVNGNVKNISKRHISSNLVYQGDGYKGPVIIKTNKNCHGVPERLKGSLLLRYLHRFGAILQRSCQSTLFVPDYHYPVLDSVDQVPSLDWYNPDLVVERFLPERNEGYYCLRTWLFMGDKERNSIWYSEKPVVKLGNAIRGEPMKDVPEELRHRRRELGFDFGKFDYAIVDGRVVLYDANWTPTFGDVLTDKLKPGIRVLADGLKTFYKY